MLNLARRQVRAAPRAVICAVLVHAAVLAAVLLAPLRRSPVGVGPQVFPPADEIAIATDLEPVGEAASAPVPRTTEPNAQREATSPTSPTSLLDRRTGSASANETAAAANESARVQPDLVAPSTGATPPPVNVFAPPTLGIALGAPNPFAARGALPDVASPPDGPSATNGAQPSAPTPAEAKSRVEASLRAAAREHDGPLGLGPEGPVLAALEQAAYASTAPVEGSAVFLARAALKGTKLRVASSGIGGLWKRIALTVQVTSMSKMPSGHDPGVTATVLGAPIRKGEGKRSTTVAILDPIPKCEVVEVDILPGLKARLPVTRWDALALEGDPVDIGAKPRRVVRTRLTKTTLL